MDYYHSRPKGIAPKRPNESFDASNGEPSAKVSCTRKRVRNRLEMKPDGSIVCETSVIEEVDDMSNTSRFNTSLLAGEKLVTLELTQGENEVDPLLGDPVDGPPPLTFFEAPNAVHFPEVKPVEVKTDLNEVDIDETPTLLELSNPFAEPAVEPESDCSDIRGPGDAPESFIPVIDISEPIVRNATTQLTGRSSQLQPSHPHLSTHLVSDKLLAGSTVSTLTPRCETASDPDKAKPKTHTANRVSNEINSQQSGVDWGKRSSEPVTVIDNIPKNTDDCPCIIETLLQTPFVNKRWTTEERKVIVVNGKPTQFPVRFKNEVVNLDNLQWLTGCSARDELYCWPCLLFHPKQVWCSVDSLLSDDALIHERTFSHKKSVAMLNKLEVHFQRVKHLRRRKKKELNPSAEVHLPKKPLKVEDQTKNNIKKPNMNTCLIQKLIALDFSSFSEEERNAIILRGRPRPPMEALAMINRHLSSKHEYEKTDWLTGSAELKTLFCWPCLLFTRKAGVWEKFGFSEFRLLADATARHETTRAHMDAYLQLKVWESQLYKMPNRFIEHKAKETKKHRDFVKYIVDVACFMEKKIDNSSVSIDDYVDVLKLVSSRDEKLKYFLKPKSLNFNESTKTLITPYLESISVSLQSVMLLRIKEELKRSPYMSLILDDTSVQDKMRSTIVAVIVRYTTETGGPCERFVKFIKAAPDRSIVMFVEQVKSLINVLECEKKFVGFAYDGGVVQSSMMPFFNNELKQAFPCSNFFQYREHLLPRLIRQSLSHLKCCRNFIIGLSEISSFFEDTPNATSSFLSMNGYQQPVEWDFSSTLILTIMKNYCSMIKFFDRIKLNGLPFKWNNKAVAQADKFVGFLLRLSNRFLIILLSKILADADNLTRVFQGNFDVMSWLAAGKHAIEKIKANNFDDIFKSACSIAAFEPRIIIPENRDAFKEIYHQVVNDVTLLLSNRTSDMQKWELFSLVPSNETFLKYLSFARNRLSAASFTIGICPSLDCQRLLPQLVLICGNERFFGNKDINALIQCLHDFEMVDTVSELYKFLMFLRTIPMIANDPSAVPTIRKVTAYIKGRKDLDSIHTLMCVERDLLTALQSEMSFHDRVIDTVISERTKKTVKSEKHVPAVIK